MKMASDFRPEISRYKVSKFILFISVFLLLSCSHTNSDNENYSDSVLVVIQGFPKGDNPISDYAENLSVGIKPNDSVKITVRCNDVLDSTKFKVSNDSITGEIQLTAKIPKICLSKYHLDSAWTHVSENSKSAYVSTFSSRGNTSNEIDDSYIHVANTFIRYVHCFDGLDQSPCSDVRIRTSVDSSF